VTAPVVVLAVMAVVQAALFAHLLVIHQRALETARVERSHLTHLAIAKHAGEVRVLDADPAGERPARPPARQIEGL